MSGEWVHETSKGEILYKYRSFKDFEHLVDIIVNSRMYAAHFEEMNDPMEGGYLTPEDPEISRKINEALSKQKFCSFSQSPDIDLMWAHYAHGNRGVCIGVALKATKFGGRALKVKYDGVPGVVDFCDRAYEDRARKILRHKSNCWSYEEEVRLFSDVGHLVDVEIKEVIFGKRADNQLRSILSKLVNNFLPNVNISNQ